MYFSLSTIYKRLECVDLKEKNRKQVYDQIKRRYNNQRKKNLFKNKLFKKTFLIRPYIRKC